MSIDPKRAKTSRGRRFLTNMAPKLHENPHSTLVLRGQKTSGLVNSVLTDLFMLKKPNGARARDLNERRPKKHIRKESLECSCWSS